MSDPASGAILEVSELVVRYGALTAVDGLGFMVKRGEILGLLGDAFKSFAEWTPVGTLITLFSTVLGSTPWGWVPGDALVSCVGYIVIFAFIGLHWFHWNAH